MGSIVTLGAALAGSSTWVNIATYDVPITGRVEALCMDCSDDCDTDGDQVLINLTFSPTPATTVNGEYASIFTATKNFQLVTSGAVNNAMQMYCKLPDIPVQPGQRIYLHGFATTGVSAQIKAQLHLSFNVPSRS